MKKQFVAFLGLALCLAACNKSNPVPQPSEQLSDVLIVNSGNMNSNNACISSYRLEDKAVSTELFFQANGQKLGDTAQDILCWKDYILIALTGSKTIFVCDANLKIVSQISNGWSPRYFCVGEDKIYVTYYEGFLGEINPADWSVRTTAVGPNPEGLAYVDGKVYAANSGGYVPGFDKTVSVVDTKEFKQISTFEVNVNPNKIVAYGDKLYISSMGNYADIPAKLQAVSLKDDYSTSDVSISGVNGLAADGKGRIYVLSGEYDANWTLTGTVSVLDAASGKVSGTFAASIGNAYSISCAKGYVFVGCSDYVDDGSVRIYSEEGTLYDDISSEGLNPIVCTIR